MKCPKCHYVSFDYNQVCPNCSKDISAEQEKLNVPAFKPDPPSLLGALLGEAHPDTQIGGPAGMISGDQEHTISMEDSSTLGSQDIEMDDSQEIELDLDLHEGKEGLGLGEVLEEHAGPSIADLTVAEEPRPAEEIEMLGTISMGGTEVSPRAGEEKEETPGEITLDFEGVTLEGIDSDVKEEGPGERLEADLGDFSLEDAGVSLEKPGPPLSDTSEIVLDLDLVPPAEEKAPAAGEQDEITLSLDDLKVNETGELEIGRDIAAKGVAPADGIAMEVKTETTAAGDGAAEDDLSLLLGEDAIEISADPEEGVETLDLENLDLELDLEEPERS